MALLAFGSYLFPLSGEKAELLKARCSDGWELAVWFRRAPQRKFQEPVILVHGLANNHRIFDLHAPLSLSQALTRAGFDCYAVDLRGAGGSVHPNDSKVPRRASIDDHIHLDASAVISFVQEHSKSSKVFWVGHSLGGLVGLALPHELHSKLSGLVTLGSPVFLTGLKLRSRIFLWLGKCVAWPFRIRIDVWARLGLPLVSMTPSYFTRGMLNAGNVDSAVRRLSLAQMIAPVWYGVLKQLSDWVKHDAFRSADGAVDYRARVASLKIPLLSIGGVVDHIAPAPMVAKAHELAGTTDKALLIEYPEGTSYGHGDLLLGRNAPLHVFAFIIEWLSSRAARV